MDLEIEILRRIKTGKKKEEEMVLIKVDSERVEGKCCKTKDC